MGFRIVATSLRCTRQPQPAPRPTEDYVPKIKFGELIPHRRHWITFLQSSHSRRCRDMLCYVGLVAPKRGVRDEGYFFSFLSVHGYYWSPAVSAAAARRCVSCECNLGVPAGADGGSSWCKQLSDRSSPTVWRQIGCRWPRASSRASDTLPCMTWPWRKTRGREDARTDFPTGDRWGIEV
jgi:hypothetical protein